MRTPEQIKAWFRNPAVFTPFGAAKKRATIAYIEQLEKKVADAQERIEELETIINLTKIQMMGDCGVCRNKNKPKVCAECRAIAYHPDWEYEGLPELPKKGAAEKR